MSKNESQKKTPNSPRWDMGYYDPKKDDQPISSKRRKKLKKSSGRRKKWLTKEQYAQRMRAMNERTYAGHCKMLIDTLPEHIRQYAKPYPADKCIRLYIPDRPSIRLEVLGGSLMFSLDNVAWEMYAGLQSLLSDWGYGNHE